MTRSLLLIATTALALSACNKRAAPATPADTGPATTTAPAATTNDDVELVELPAMQADLVAKAGGDTVYFALDEHALDQEDRTLLMAQAKWLLANPNVRASIEGHADERGTRDYNLALGERRANAARDYLLAQGVPAARLSVISWGKERPADPASTEAAWAKNRRAVTVVVR